MNELVTPPPRAAPSPASISPSGPYVWIAEEDTAHRVPVRLVERLKGRILVEGELREGDMIIGEGVQSMREGLTLRVMDARAIAKDIRDSSDSADSGT